MEQLGLGCDDRRRRRPLRQPQHRSHQLRESGAGGRQNRPLSRRPTTRTLKPEDSVLIDIDFKKDKPARLESQGAGLPPITIPAEPAPILEAGEREELQQRIDLVRSRNPYQLDSIRFTAAARIRADHARWPQRGAGDASSFGDRGIPQARRQSHQVAGAQDGRRRTETFRLRPVQGRSATFAPVGDVPVPSDYIVGPGDQIIVQLFGSQNRTLRLTVGRDGRISFPELGPINVGGQTFERVANDLEARVSRQMIGVRASVGMGATRSIRVFVMGETNRPGSYTVSGLTTVTSALYASGGVKPIGSLRDIQLKRQGAVIRRLDLYDLLLRGDTSGDAKLLPGDVIFIPPVSATVAVDGEVQRPAIYELKGTTSVADIIQLAGGTTSEADTGRAALVRVNDRRARVVVNVPLDTPAGRSELLRNGDSLRVLRLRPDARRRRHGRRSRVPARAGGLARGPAAHGCPGFGRRAQTERGSELRTDPPGIAAGSSHHGGIGRPLCGAARSCVIDATSSSCRVIASSCSMSSPGVARCSIHCWMKSVDSRASISPAKSCELTGASKRAATIRSSAKCVSAICCAPVVACRTQLTEQRRN